MRVLLFTAEYGGDAQIPRPGSFVATRNLTRHAFEAYDMGRRRPEIGLRVLPLISDVLAAAYDATAGLEAGSDACDARRGPRRGVYLGYTNADIGVQEDFYVVAAGLARASDAFVINRVEVPDRKADGAPYGPQDLDAIYALGKRNAQKHPGYDCFFWRRDATPALRLFSRGVFVGYPPVGKHLTQALQCCATSKLGYREVRGRKHTFHLGDRNGGWTKFPEYEHFNRKAARRAPRDFAAVPGVSCQAARRALDGHGDAACAVDRELAARPFARWDVPGSEWPPRES